MYPDETTLMEVGRIAIAAGRLDAELGALWWHLAPDLIAELDARTASAGKVRDRIRELCRERLDQVHADTLVGFVDEVDATQQERNDVLHSRWLLDGRDAMRPVSEFFELSEAAREEYLEAWERQAKTSEEWQRQPSRAMTLAPPHTLDELVVIERRLRRAANVAVQWQFRIASMREAGVPEGWHGPAEARRTPSSEAVGERAKQALRRLECP